MIDTHCHLTSKQLCEDVEQVIERAKEHGVSQMITVALNGADAIHARECASHFEEVYFSAGIHPLYADGEWDWNSLGTVIRDEKCVAFGELGLDKHYEESDFDLQLGLLEQQLDFVTAQKGDFRPIIVHSRKAVGDLLPIFKSSGIDGDRFVFHCFTESMDDAKQVLDFGAMISFTGVVTYKNASEVLDVAQFMPIDRMMVETDAPYLTPEPNRKIWPNEPRFVVDTAARIAQSKGLSEATFEQAMDENARRFFGLPKP
ncbi:MAG: hypothetical protein CMJ38_01395 [Phycisphaerae bacterium]|nr:hypothetical protein [Phycisphaerae bacterium]